MSLTTYENELMIAVGYLEDAAKLLDKHGIKGLGGMIREEAQQLREHLYTRNMVAISKIIEGQVSE